MKKFMVKQTNIKDCGVACLASVIKYYKGYVGLEKLREMTKTDNNGTTAYHLKTALINLGFSCQVIKYNNLIDNDFKINTPCIAHIIINESYCHYVVIYKINNQRKQITIMDPSYGYKKYSFDEFNKIWSKVLILFYPLKNIPTLNKPKTIFEISKTLLSPHKKGILGIILLSLLFIIFNIANSFYFKYIIDNITKTTLNNLNYISLLFLLIIILKLITDFFRNQILIHINKKIDITLFVNSINHIISLPYSYYKNRTTGDIISRVNDLSYIRDMISRVSITLFIDSILVAFVIFFLYYLNHSLFFVSFSIIVIYILIILLFNPLMQKHINSNIKEHSAITSYLFEIITAFETIKGLHLEKMVKEVVSNKYNVFATNISKSNFVYNYQNIIKDTINLVGTFTILFVGSLLVYNNQMSVGSLITYYVLFLYFIEPIRNIIDLEPTIRQAYEAIRRIDELYEIDEEQFTKDEKKELRGDITFHHLNFSYNSIDYVLHDINLKIKNHEKVLIVGESGSGKSTLVKLLLRYYQPNKNQLIIDDLDINDYSLNTIRENISYVSQNETLFTDTIYNNIDMNRNISNNKIEEVSKLVMVNEIVKNNSIGYSLLLEENGNNISGGERQKIILARALLKESPILILDESTNQIDLLKERIIFNNIFKKYIDKTIIVITHRHENSDLFDKVITLNKKGE